MPTMSKPRLRLTTATIAVHPWTTTCCHPQIKSRRTGEADQRLLYHSPKCVVTQNYVGLLNNWKYTNGLSRAHRFVLEQCQDDADPYNSLVMMMTLLWTRLRFPFIM
jgi:hypothetical protein